MEEIRLLEMYCLKYLIAQTPIDKAKYMIV